MRLNRPITIEESERAKEFLKAAGVKPVQLMTISELVVLLTAYTAEQQEAT